MRGVGAGGVWVVACVVDGRWSDERVGLAGGVRVVWRMGEDMTRGTVPRAHAPEPAEREHLGDLRVLVALAEGLADTTISHVFFAIIRFVI